MLLRGFVASWILFFHLDDAQKSFVLRVGTTFAADICSTHARPAAPYTSHLRGSPGTGKSLLILSLQKLCALIVEHHLCSQDEIDSCILLVTHDGARAQLIGVQTLDSVINSFSPAASLENVFLGGVRLVVVEERFSSLVETCFTVYRLLSSQVRRFWQPHESF